MVLVRRLLQRLPTGRLPWRAQLRAQSQSSRPLVSTRIHSRCLRTTRRNRCRRESPARPAQTAARLRRHRPQEYGEVVAARVRGEPDRRLAQSRPQDCRRDPNATDQASSQDKIIRRFNQGAFRHEQNYCALQRQSHHPPGKARSLPGHRPDHDRRHPERTRRPRLRVALEQRSHPVPADRDLQRRKCRAGAHKRPGSAATCTETPRTATLNGFEVYGDPGPKATEVLNGIGARIFPFWRGLDR